MGQLAAPAIGADALAPVVARVLDRPDARVLEWRVRSIHDVFVRATGGVFRVEGTAAGGGREWTWSVVLKTLRRVPDRDDPAQIYYWKREPLLYRSGALADLPGLPAPRCYGVVEPDPASCWLWLEDVPDAGPERWGVGEYARAAHHTGELNGAYLAGRPLPPAAHAAGTWIAGMLEAQRGRLPQLATHRDHPALRRACPGDLLDRTIALWETRAPLLEAYHRLPYTFCHGDTFRGNLHLRDGRIVAIDWAFAGASPIGTDLAVLLWASAAMNEADVADAPALEAAALDAYLAGLRAAGWSPDERIVRAGYALATGLRFAWQSADWGLADAQDQGRQAYWERRFGRPYDGVLEVFAILSRHALDLAEEARTLIA